MNIDHHSDPPRDAQKPPGLDHDREERQGWAGLVLTLVVCLIAFIVWEIAHAA